MSKTTWNYWNPITKEQSMSATVSSAFARGFRRVAAVEKNYCASQASGSRS